MNSVLNPTHKASFAQTRWSQCLTQSYYVPSVCLCTLVSGWKDKAYASNEHISQYFSKWGTKISFLCLSKTASEEDLKTLIVMMKTAKWSFVNFGKADNIWFATYKKKSVFLLWVHSMTLCAWLNLVRETLVIKLQWLFLYTHEKFYSFWIFFIGL